MNRLLFGLFVMFGISINAQMYVSPGSYMYVNDTYVYVTQEVNLDKSGSDEGNIYLRNQSQLLQGTTGAGANEGEGTLSVFQEGTTNNYHYNYWCSPIGDANATPATPGNSNFGITLFRRPTSKTISELPNFTGGLDGSTTGSNLTISSRWIYTYVQGNVYDLTSPQGWQYVAAATDIEPGLGFTMKGVNGTDTTVADPDENVQNNTGSAQRYDFRGKPNDGTIVALVDNTSDSYANETLVGNPYPSAINLNYYLLENAGYTIDASGNVSATATGGTIDGSAYFWQHYSTDTHVTSEYVGGYGVYTPNGSNIGTIGSYAAAPANVYAQDGESTTTTGTPGGDTIKRMFAPVGQGFMVRGTVSNGTVTMRNKYRVFYQEDTDYSQFARSANTNAHLTTTTEYWEEIPNVAGIDYTQIVKAQVPQFKIHTEINDEVLYETVAAFNSIATDDYEVGFDARTDNANNDKTTYFTANEGANKLVITTMPFDINKTIPVAFKCNETSSFKVSVSELINFDLSSEIYLHDFVNDVYYDILNDEALVVLPAGENANQFEVTFVANSTLHEESQEVANSFSIFQNNTQNVLTLVNPMLKEVNNVTVFDVTGKMILTKQNLGSNSKIEIPTGNLSTGVYVVKVATASGVKFSKKIMVK